MIEILDKGTFSRETIPNGWVVDTFTEVANDLSILSQELNSDSRIVGIIQRSSGSTTVLVQNSDNRLMILQVQENLTNSQKASNSWRTVENKFDGSRETSEKLIKAGISVPQVLVTGKVKWKGEERSYTLSEFIPGQPADRFLSSNPEYAGQVYNLFGRELGKMANVLGEKQAKNSRSELYDGFERSTKFLTVSGLLTPDEVKEILFAGRSALEVFPTSERRFVQADPFPVNLQVSGVRSNLKLSILDIESIVPGDTMIEGVGRALNWSCRDWVGLKGMNLDPEELEIELVEGFNSTAPTQFVIQEDRSHIKNLRNTSELFWLLTAIYLEQMKIEPSENPNRRINKLKNIVNNFDL